jgi:hypothetical protein
LYPTILRLVCSMKCVFTGRHFLRQCQGRPHVRSAEGRKMRRLNTNINYVFEHYSSFANLAAGLQHEMRIYRASMPRPAAQVTEGRKTRRKNTSTSRNYVLEMDNMFCLIRRQRPRPYFCLWPNSEGVAEGLERFY